MAHKKISIGIFGNQHEVVKKQTAMIKKALASVTVSNNLNPDIISCLNSLSVIPDIPIINLTDHAIKELDYLGAEITKNKVIVVGDKSDAKLLGYAISAGVTEFIDNNNWNEEIIKVIKKTILTNVARHTNTDITKSKITAFIDAKGGSGASFLASNIACILSETKDLKVALLDLDLQFGSIGLNFDVTPKYTVVDALNSIDEIDALALEAHMAKYSEQLYLLLPSPEEIILPGEIKPAAMNSLLHLIERRYNQIVIDLPRIIDPLSTEIFDHVKNVVIVVQQTLAQYRDSRRMIQILTNDLEIPVDKIIIVINRYDSRSNLKKADMVKYLGQKDQVFTIANDFRKVANASDLGEPLCKIAPNSRIVKDLKKLAIYLGDVGLEESSSGLFGRLKGLFA